MRRPMQGGGVYGDKPAALERIKKSFKELLPQNVKDRLVLENDEVYSSIRLPRLVTMLILPSDVLQRRRPASALRRARHPARLRSVTPTLSLSSPH
jgi:UV DNA damage endonuclease